MNRRKKNTGSYSKRSYNRNSELKLLDLILRRFGFRIVPFVIVIIALAFGGKLIGYPQLYDLIFQQETSISTGEYYVSRVVDGDTMLVRYIDKNGNEIEEKLRLIGVDTPESVSPDPSRNTDAGKDASSYTKSRLEHKKIELEFDAGERDKYGRLLAYVYIDGKMYNEELLEKGYARTMTIPPNVKYSDRFHAIEQKAKRDGKGFWKGASPYR